MFSRWPLRLAAGIMGVAVLGALLALATEHRAPRSAPRSSSAVRATPAPAPARRE